MTEPISFDPEQRLRLGLRGQHREVAAKVVAVREDTLWVHLVEPALGLEASHLVDGIDLAFWRDGTRYVAEAVTIVASDLDRGRLQLSRPKTTREVQRRQSFREEVKLPIRLESTPETTEQTEAITCDLSGNGLCLRCSPGSNLSVHDELKLELKLPDRVIRARARVRWTREEPDGLARLGLEFTRIAEREQDRLFEYLFAVQRGRIKPPR